MCLPILNPPPSSLPTPSFKVVPEHRPWVSSFMHRTCCCCCCLVASVVSNSVQPHRRQPTRLSRPWDSPGKNTGVGCHFLLLAIVIYFTYDNTHISMLFYQIIPPSPSPRSPNFCSLHLCLFRCPAYRVIVTVFLNSIHIFMFLFMTYFTLYNRLQFHLLH